jgi:hypothetical protein
MFSNRVTTCFKRAVSSLSEDYREYLFEKFEIRPNLFAVGQQRQHDLEQQTDELNRANDPRVLTLLEDLISNRQYYRSSVSPRYVFDVPFDDLLRFLRLDGWDVANGALQRIEPMGVDRQQEEDSLILSIRSSGLPNSNTIETHLRRSAEAYGRDNNSCMTNSRQALEQVLLDIAQQTANARGDAVPPSEQVREYLENCGFLNREEKRGISGAYGFLSGGAHPGVADEEAARLGRNFAIGACHYSIQKYQRWVQNGYRSF